VSGIVIHDDMDIEPFGDLSINSLQYEVSGSFVLMLSNNNEFF
jgi:hypothetical protein